MTYTQILHQICIQFKGYFLNLKNTWESKSGNIMVSSIKLYYKVIVTKTVWHRHKNRYIDQLNRIEIPEVNPQICKINQYVKYSKLIYNKGARNILWGNDSHFNKRCWKIRTATCKEMKLDNCLIPYTKMNTKWIKILNVRPEALKLLEEKDVILTDISLSEFLHLTQKAKATKAKRNKCDYIKLKSFSIAEDTINKMKRKPTEWEKMIHKLCIW